MTEATILFIHGAAGDSRVWAPVIAALPAGLAGIAPTLTYFGKDEWPDDGRGFGTEIHCRDIIRAARMAGHAVHLVCWSYAVHPGLAALLEAPELFASALFYEAGLPHYISSASERKAFSESAADLFGPVGRALAEHGPEASVEALVGPKAFARLPAERQAIYLSNARMMPLLMGGGRPPAMITPRELATIATPCCAALGLETQPAFAIPTRALAAAIPGAVLEEVAGADHFLPETDPGGFAALVRDWVASVSRDG